MSEILDPVTAPPHSGVLVTESPLPSPERLSPVLVAALLLSQFGLAVPVVGMFAVSLPTTVAGLDPTGKATSLSLIMGLHAVVGILVSPIAGVLSDRCTSRLGMRRPFLLVGGAVGVGGMFLMAAAPNLQVLLAGALLSSAGSGIYAGGNAALIPDQVPERHRGKMMGMNQVMLGLGGLTASIVIPMFLGNQFLVFAVPASFMGVATLAVTLLIKDRRLTSDQLEGTQDLRGLLAQFKVNPKEVPDYSWAWTGKAITTLGTVLTGVYGIYFLTDVLAIKPENLGAVITLTSILGLGTSIGGAVLGSWISDRFKIRKNMVLYTSALIAVGAIVSAFSPNLTVYIIGMVIMGIGAGAYFPVDGALMIDVLPGHGKDSGKFMGLMTLADQVPRSVGPFLAAGVLSAGYWLPTGGYQTVFLAGGVIAIVGGLLVRKVKGSH